MSSSVPPEAASINALIDAGDPQGSLQRLAAAYPGRVVLSTSFSWEDQAITHLIASLGLPIGLFTLDTGRLFAETYSTWATTIAKYGIRIEAYYPEQEPLQAFVSSHGPNAFYESVALRQQCCYLRKVVPLKKALTGKQVWITGIRAEHSPHRQDMQQLEWDTVNQIWKYHPLLHWSTDELKAFIKANGIPANPLHEKGFVSIGCAPCTRAVQPGEDFRAGRWWWEDAGKKECGLHVHSS
jgi:phosphoadenosine phosphosulfate reductase